jgi:hypothetical protein
MNRTALPRHLGLLLAGVLAAGLAACGAAAGPPSSSPTGDTGDQFVGVVPGMSGTPTPTGGATIVSVPPSPPPVEPAQEDCVSYDPSNLTVTADGDAWLLRDGGHRMKLFDTQADAEDARRVARNWQQMCYIGRGNSGPDRYRTMVNYFQQPSGLPLGPAPVTLDCVTYDPDDLAIYHGPGHPANPDEDDWALFSGGIPLVFLATEPDALRAQEVASDYTRLCHIGAGNDRPDPFRYSMEWWRP